MKPIDRVRKFGEVKTKNNEIKNMISLVNDEVLRVDSRFLESACGDGNFIVEILNKKLKNIYQKFKKDHKEFEKNALYVSTSLYGIELLEDNVEKTRSRLFETLSKFYNDKYNYVLEKDLALSIKYVFKKNIIHGNALTLKTVKKNEDIIFAEWSMVNATDFKRRDYTLNELLAYQPIKEENLFSDLGDKAFIPTPIKEYQPKHYLKIYEYSNSR